jgi:hypothetical protein
MALEFAQLGVEPRDARVPVERDAAARVATDSDGASRFERQDALLPVRAALDEQRPPGALGLDARPELGGRGEMRAVRTGRHSETDRHRG